MSIKTEQAAAAFSSGYNCAQSVFSPFAAELGIDPASAIRVAQAFGGGIVSRGETCGAVTGALMAIGLKYGKTHPTEDAARDKTYQLVNEFIRRFEAEHGSLQCQALLGFHLNDPVQSKAVQEAPGYQSPCPKLVAAAAAILEEIL